ncbi:MAG: hypothetical protein K6C34_02825 [Alphaproteobacteria bacterium]|nr:hypothetical protein [Alphaproteobacteria bacterium]
MKKIVLGSLCLLLAACSTEKPCYRENCFVTEHKVTEDMQKIRSIAMDYYKRHNAKDLEYKLKFINVTCRLFGKNNKRLNKEIDKLQKVYYSQERNTENRNLYNDLKKSLKGLKLDYDQVLQLAKILEKDIAEISKSNQKKFAPYKSRALEIVNAIDAQREKQNEWSYGHYEDELHLGTKFSIYFAMQLILTDNYNRFDSYNMLIDRLEGLISEGILVDSFLTKHPSPILPKYESLLELDYYTHTLTPPKTKNGELIFEAAKRATSDKSISKQELADLTTMISNHMRGIASNITDIQHDVTDRIDYNSFINSYNEKTLSNFRDSSRYPITDLVDKYPKFEDFDREINKLATRIAYQTYYKVNIARFLYKECRSIYYKQTKELFTDAVKVADKLYAMIRDDVISDDTPTKRAYEYTENMKNISNIKEIAKIGVDRILPSADCYIDSQEEIKSSLYKSFMQIREAYLKNTGE